MKSLRETLDEFEDYRRAREIGMSEVEAFVWVRKRDFFGERQQGDYVVVDDEFSVGREKTILLPPAKNISKHISPRRPRKIALREVFAYKGFADEIKRLHPFI